jgi:flagellar biosynthesis anti-sigma factor FlgM
MGRTGEIDNGRIGSGITTVAAEPARTTRKHSHSVKHEADSVNIRGIAVDELRKKMQAMPDVGREERVAQLQAKVADGSYVVDASSLASKLIGAGLVR